MNKILGIILGIILVVVVLNVGMYSSFNTKYHSVKTKESNIETLLTQRADKIGNLVSTVKGYSSHEQECIAKITEARKTIKEAKDFSEITEASQELDEGISGLLVSVESNPELKADKLYIRLMDEIAGSENRIAIAREEYNEAVQSYNLKVTNPISSIFANIFGFDEYELYKAPAEKLDVPVVSFD